MINCNLHLQMPPKAWASYPNVMLQELHPTSEQATHPGNAAPQPARFNALEGLDVRGV